LAISGQYYFMALAATGSSIASCCLAGSETVSLTIDHVDESMTAR